jgi:predicted ATP-binding protein involved in virulence
MQLESLNIIDFKNFAKRELKFHPQFNLIIGNNGSGKTSVLSAAAVALAAWSRSYMPNDVADRPIEGYEAREFYGEGHYIRSPSAIIEASGTTSIVDIHLEKKEGLATWSRTWKEGNAGTTTSGTIKYKNRGAFSSKSYDLQLDLYKDNIFKYLEKNGDFDLPLFAFYGCDRLWFKEPSKENIEESATARHTRFDAYAQCFHTGAAASDVVKWLIKHALASSQQKNPTNALQVILEAAKTGLENCVDLQYDFEQSRVIVKMKDESQIAYEHLSDGQRTMLGLFCDIARRASLLNPHHGAKAASLTRGVVLIDELDLHLHPTWQRSIIEKLRCIFPNIQFICTTHSPFLIQSLRDGSELLMLAGQSIPNLGHLSLEAIASGLMSVDSPQVSQRYVNQHLRARSALENLLQESLKPEEKLQRYKEMLIDDQSVTGSDPTLQAMMEVMRAAKGK